MKSISYCRASTLSNLTIALLCGSSLIACDNPADKANSSDVKSTDVPISVEKPRRSMVVLGDSVAAGEGINYGYSYDLNSIFGARWVGGVRSPKWQGDYQECHQSDKAYSDVLAQELGYSLAKFACTGATYKNGLISQRKVKDVVYRPAEFGNWQDQTELNPDYDAAKPDVVMLTFGADDVDFVGMVTYCVLSFIYDDLDQLHSELESETHLFTALREKLEFHYPDAQTFSDKKAMRAKRPPVCTAANPGKTLETLFWKPINDGSITKHYIEMIDAIKQRGKRAGKVPEIVFTTYHNPLPSDEQSISCHDTFDLDRQNIDYLNALLTKLNQTIIASVKDIPGVRVVDVSRVVNGHRWCSKEPWVYGLSVLWENFKSQAPFHPTAEGQRAIAQAVKAELESTLD